MKVRVKKLTPTARIPAYATEGAACFDLCSLVTLDIHPTDTAVIPTGLAFEVPPGFVMLVFSRSGMAVVGGRLGNCVGVIDSDYRGEVSVLIHNDGHKVIGVRSGDRIAQALILPVPGVEPIEAEELSSTARGAGGFGSTGA